MKKIGKTILSSIMALSIIGVGVKSVKAADGSVGVGMFKEKGSSKAGAKVEAGIENLVLKNLGNDASLFLDAGFKVINHPKSKNEWHGGSEFDATLMCGLVPTKEFDGNVGVGLAVIYNSTGTHVEEELVKSYRQIVAGSELKVSGPISKKFRLGAMHNILFGKDSNGDAIFRGRVGTNLDYKLTKNFSVGGIVEFDGYGNFKRFQNQKGGQQTDLGLQLKLHPKGRDMATLKTVYSCIEDDNRPYNDQVYVGLLFHPF